MIYHFWRSDGEAATRGRARAGAPLRRPEAWLRQLTDGTVSISAGQRRSGLKPS